MTAALIREALVALRLAVLELSHARSLGQDEGRHSALVKAWAAIRAAMRQSDVALGLTPDREPARK